MARVEHSSIEVKLKRVDRIYRSGETVTGHVIVNAKDGWSHSGITMHAIGQATLQLSARSVGIFDAMSKVAPLILFEKNLQILPPGRLRDHQCWCRP